MIFLKDILFLAKQTKITSALIIINIAWFTISHLLDSRGFIPFRENEFLINWGADMSQLAFAGQYWRMFTNLFMHAGVIHLTMNMLALWSIGSILERLIPPFAFLGIYLLSGLFGSLASDIATINQYVISCGASGAILGIITALLAFSLINRANITEMPIKSIVVSLILTAGLGLLPSIDGMAHIGGAATGFILGSVVAFCLRTFNYPSKSTVIIVNLVFVMAIIILYFGYMHYKIPGTFYY